MSRSIRNATPDDIAEHNRLVSNSQFTLLPAFMDVHQFCTTFRHAILDNPQVPHPDRQVLRSKLIREEYHEFMAAWDQCASARKQSLPQEIHAMSLANLADALGDLIYVIIGCALEYGIPLHLVWQAIQKANMDKVWLVSSFDDEQHMLDYLKARGLTGNKLPDGNYVVYDASGKVMKPVGWQPPDILSIITKAMENTNESAQPQSSPGHKQ